MSFVAPIALSVVAFSFYRVAVKHFSHDKLCLVFWMGIISYAQLLTIFAVKKFFLLQDITALEAILRPPHSPPLLLCAIIAGCLLASTIIFIKITHRYPLTVTVLALQIGIGYKAALYKLLGAQISFVEIIGVLVICAGAVVAGLPQIRGMSWLDRLRNIPKTLFYLCALESVIVVALSFLGYHASHGAISTPINLQTIRSLDSFDFSYFNPAILHAKVRILLIIFFFIYLAFTRRIRNLFQELRHQWGYILYTASVYTLSQYGYYQALSFEPVLQVVTAASRLTLPLIIALSLLFLHERLSRFHIASLIAITTGSIIMML